MTSVQMGPIGTSHVTIPLDPYGGPVFRIYREGSRIRTVLDGHGMTAEDARTVAIYLNIVAREIDGVEPYYNEHKPTRTTSPKKKVTR